MAAPAIQEPSVYIAPPAEVVGNAFARQYYTILQQSPSLVYRFYQDVSKLGRTGDNGVMNSTTTMDAINEKIQSYGSLRADLKFVDAQESYNGGVIVLVTGFMVNDDDSRRGFTQTFFLAPQDKGYFVLNDIFRYVEGDFQHIENPHNEIQDNGIAPNTASQEKLPVQENHINRDSNGEVFHPHDNGDVSVEAVEEVVEEEPVVEEELVAEVIDEAPSPPTASQDVEADVKVVADSPNDSQVSKKSYASIVMKDTPVLAPSPNYSKAMPRVQERKTQVTPTPVALVPPSNTDVLEDENNHEPEGDSHSIYVKNLPLNVTPAVVEEAFKSFGKIKSNGIQIRLNKGFCFGFVEFEEAGAVHSAIEASPIPIGGRDVVVEEKKSPSFRGLNRGRYPPGRGGGFNKSEGSRGRGTYGGGRGYSRGEFRNDFGNRGGGRGYYNRSEGFNRNDQTGFGGGRANRGGGSGIANSRAQRVPAQS
ncbi:nuclear transport factor 2-like isoform X2 [Amaranthus tricolor]|uniref:nuclear transport factor 2-like isoform X2 n=1 Tax=Amaranthus tricolor TaxID=29722 RepID=UPI00258309C7|nr:nuclear transport factor 2-like isoform X2 [Amaranthus tricolor]